MSGEGLTREQKERQRRGYVRSYLLTISSIWEHFWIGRVAMGWAGEERLSTRIV